MIDVSKLIKTIDIKIGGGKPIQDNSMLDLLYKVSMSKEDFECGQYLESNYYPEKHLNVIFNKNELLGAIYKGMEGMRSSGGVRQLSINYQDSIAHADVKTPASTANLYIEITIHSETIAEK